ncbi:polar amino acid transport system permease protein [Azospirillum lipoferum]|uniref:Amino acid ABC transporter permease n=1 Tax=Azospirillum lipoferum TaxID=193 RepID=A0A5A9FXW4_AZOLI|nr:MULTISPECIES: amino acid ABC transporter permease [Azospirillum]KAA0587163.1 amino acid ABC transporter permease [Azospirillum lipoferum]MCP1615084.1 polar amino acid transport system permease protein [Azospirillum lipoferum]MDW5532982.1 amino acid ABC transporter permease [Azospirillum sp. NL1]
MSYQWDFSPVLTRWPLLLDGLLNTVKIAAIAIVFGVLVGLVLALLRLSPRRYLRLPAAAFVEFYRNTPPIVHFFWFFYALPVVLNISLDPLVAAVLALSTQSGAFYAEVFRGGIRSIERGQWEGAKALGMTHTQLMRRIVVPQAATRMIAPFVERSFELIKTTALASTLAYGELLYQAMMVNSETFRPLEVYTTVALLYLVLLVSCSALARVAEARLTAYR